MATVAPEFISSIQRGLAHWEQFFTDLPESTYGEVAHRASLARMALELGLQHPKTLTAALNLLMVLLDPYIIHHARPSVWIPLLHLGERYTSSNEQRGILLCRLSELCMRNDELDNTELLLAQAEQIGQIEANPNLLSWVYLSRSDWHLCFYRLDEARECVITAKTYLEENDLHDVLWSRVAGVMNTFGRVAYQMGHWEEAIEHYGRAYQLYIENEQLVKQAIVAQNMGDAYMEQEDYEAADAKFVEAILIHRQCQNRYQLAKTQIGHAYFYGIRGDWRLAYTLLHEVDQTYLYKAGCRRLVAYIHNNMGYYITQQGELDTSEQHYRKAISLWETVGDDVMRANSLGNLSMVLWDQGKQNEARDVYYEVHNILCDYASTEAADSYFVEFQSFWADKVT